MPSTGRVHALWPPIGVRKHAVGVRHERRRNGGRARSWRGDGPKHRMPKKSGPAVNVTVKKNRDNLRAPAFTHPVHLWGMRARHTRTESSLYLYVCPWKVGSQGGTQRRLTVVGAAWQPAKQPSSQMRGPVTRGRYHSVTFVAARPCCRRSFDVASPSRCFLRACRRSSTA